MSALAARAPALALFAAAFASSACAPPPHTPCELVSADSSAASLAALYAKHRSPLLVMKEGVLVCPCGATTESPKVGGAAEASRVGGAVESPKVGGAVESPKVGGAVEASKVGGAVEASKVGGATEEARSGGVLTGFICYEAPPCSGYRVTGEGPLKVFNGHATVDSADRCVGR